MKQSIHHLNVDCVHGHLEIVLIQCVKRWPFTLPPLYEFWNVLSWLVVSCQKGKAFYSTVMQ